MLEWNNGSTTPRILWVAVSLGMLVLLLCAYFLGRTRWMQQRPIATCGLLSVLAHLLLVGVAWMTHWSETPRLPGGGPIRLSLDDVDQPQGEEAAATPIQQLPTLQTLPDSESAAARLWDDVPQMLAQAASPDQPPVPDPPPAETPSVVEPPPPAPTTETISDATPAADTDASDTTSDPTADDPQALAQTPTTTDPADAVSQTTDQLTATEPKADPSDTPADDPSTAAEAAATHAPTPSASPTPVPFEENWGPATATATPAVPVLRNGKPLPETYRLRLLSSRLRAAQDRGGNADTEAAVESSLQWLASNQSPDGRWDASAYGSGIENNVDGQYRHGAGGQADHAMTGLALLTFLGAGYTHLEGEHRECVQHGLEYLMRGQDSDGSLAGDTNPYARMYCHGIALFAMCEAYAMTGDTRLGATVRRGIAYTIHTQDPYGGGWRYTPGSAGDTSQFGWQVLALVSAQNAELGIPAATRAGMDRFLHSVSTGRYGGLASYQPAFRATRAMTAEALVCRLFLRSQTDPATLDEAANFILEELPGDGSPNLYYWYYATLALVQRDDDRWQRWNHAMQQQLLASQRTDGVYAGSWDPRCIWGGYGGRVYSTALSAMCLEVYYRYLPLYHREKF